MSFSILTTRPYSVSLRGTWPRGWNTCELSFIDTIICVGTLPTLGVSHYNSSVLLPLRSTSTVLSESCVSVNLRFDLLQVATWECGGAQHPETQRQQMAKLRTPPFPPGAPMQAICDACIVKSKSPPHLVPQDTFGHNVTSITYPSRNG